MSTDTRSAVQPLRKLYRDRLLVLAALDLASTVENEPVLPFTTVGAHLSDLADAALGAALTVASRSVCGEDAEPPRLAVIAMGKCGARELNYVSDVDVIFVAETPRRFQPGRSHPGGRRDDAVRLRGVLRGRRGAAARGQARATGAHAGVAHRLLPALGQDLGVPGAAQGAAGGRRRRTRRAVHRRADADGVDGLRARGLRARGAGDAPSRRGTGARRGAGPRNQARHRRAARRRVRRAAAATRARPQRRIAARRVDGGRAGRARRRRLRRARRRRQHDRVLRVPAAARAPAAAAAAQAHPHAARDRRRRGDAVAGPRGARAARRPARRAGRAARRAQAAKPAGVAAARQALLSAAAGVGWSTGAGLFGGYDARGRRTSARRTGLRGPAERADPPGGADQPQRPARPGATGAAADAAGLALRYARIPTPACWRIDGSARSCPTIGGICRRCATRVRWPSG